MLSDSVPGDVKQVLLPVVPTLRSLGLSLSLSLLWGTEFHLNAFLTNRKVVYTCTPMQRVHFLFH